MPTERFYFVCFQLCQLKVQCLERLITTQDVVRVLIIMLLLVGHMTELLFHHWLFFLVHVYQATWDSSGVEMRNLTRTACGSHASFHVISKQGFDLICKGSKE